MSKRTINFTRLEDFSVSELEEIKLDLESEIINMKLMDLNVVGNLELVKHELEKRK